MSGGDLAGNEHSGAPLTFGTVVVIGGGCYGSYYVRQLRRAAAAGAVRIGDLVVVDRDPRCAVAIEPDAPGAVLSPRLVVAEWGEFLSGYLARAAEAPEQARDDAIVPSPLMPHLLYQWLVARVRAAVPDREIVQVPVGDALPVPWQRDGEDGTRYASFATWTCPINCIEPARCPHTRGARDWTMPAALVEFAAAEARAGRELAGPYVFHCTHRTYGVGMIDVTAALAAEADLVARARQRGVEALIGTVSHCHGAIGCVRVAGPGDAVPC